MQTQEQLSGALLTNNNTYSNKLSKARLAALNAIMDIRKNQSFARDVLVKTLDSHVLSNSDRAFAANLTLGVTQMLGTLDDVIYRCVDSPDDIKNNVMDCLRISTYEIIYLEKEPHAAVDQGVELVKAVEPKARGLANLVLRRVVKLKPDFPFGDPDEDIEAFARIYAIPKWECQLIFDSIGEKAGRYLISSSNGQPTIYVFINCHKISKEQAMQMFEQAGAKPCSIQALCGVNLDYCIRIDYPLALQKPELKQAMKDGQYLICDAASQAIVTNAISALDNSAHSMLEVCAGKGTKTIMFQILAQQKFGAQFQLDALDINESKIVILKKRSRRYDINQNDIKIVDAASRAALNRELAEKKYDFVFVDTPCSGLGTLSRHPELKWRLTSSKIDELADTSFKILCNASRYVKSNGILAFATCTVTKQENNNQIKHFLETDLGQDFTLVPYVVNNKQVPYFYTQTYSGLNDSHFCAILKRK